MQYLPAQNDRKAIYYYYIIILLFYYYYIIILLLLYWTFRIHIAQRLSCARIYKKNKAKKIIRFEFLLGKIAIHLFYRLYLPVGKKNLLAEKLLSYYCKSF